MSDKENIKGAIKELDETIAGLSQILVEGQDEMAVAADEATEALQRVDQDVDEETANLKNELSQIAAQEIQKGMNVSTETQPVAQPQTAQTEQPQPPTEFIQ